MRLADFAAGAAGQYVHWGVIQLSLTNLLIVAGMLLLFALAVLVPFPHHADEGPESIRPAGDEPVAPTEDRP